MNKGKMNSVVSFDDVTIQKLFGHEAAENETIERLKEYYFKTSIYDRVNSDVQLRILVGHKGIGKSALFQVAKAEDEDSGKIPIMVRPDDIAELGHDNSSPIRLINGWKAGLRSIIAEKILSNLSPSSSLMSRVINSAGEIVKVLGDVIDQSNVKIDESKRHIYDRLKGGKEIVVYIDDLDRAWENKKEDVKRISALLNAVRDLANENRKLQFRISLRSDVYYLVRTSDESTDKIEGSVVWYSWTYDEILILLVKRISTFFEVDVDDVKLASLNQLQLSQRMDKVFCERFEGRGKWSNVPMHQVLMTLIRKRPRDLVKLCSLAATQAYKDNSLRISAKHFLPIFEDYSQGRIQDSINEYRSELPRIDKLLFGMKPSSSKRAKKRYIYSTNELRAKIRSIIEQGSFKFANGNVASPEELMQFLYKINFLTARKGGEGEFIQRKYFEENRYLSNEFVDFGFDWEVHPAYRWALQPDSIEKIFEDL